MTDTQQKLAERVAAAIITHIRPAKARHYTGGGAGSMSKETPRCPRCGKRDIVPSENKELWFCANCLESVRIKPRVVDDEGLQKLRKSEPEFSGTASEFNEYLGLKPLTTDNEGELFLENGGKIYLKKSGGKLTGQPIPLTDNEGGV